jgi:hypothetical protein
VENSTAWSAKRYPFTFTLPAHPHAIHLYLYLISTLVTKAPYKPPKVREASKTMLSFFDNVQTEHFKDIEKASELDDDWAVRRNKLGDDFVASITDLLMRKLMG